MVANRKLIDWFVSLGYIEESLILYQKDHLYYWNGYTIDVENIRINSKYDNHKDYIFNGSSVYPKLIHNSGEVVGGIVFHKISFSCNGYDIIYALIKKDIGYQIGSYNGDNYYIDYTNTNLSLI